MDDAGSCPLCAAESPMPAGETRVARRTRHFLRCPACGLVFVPVAEHPTLDEERLRYGSHQNAGDDPGHRARLLRVLDALRAGLPPPASVLDYGSGPRPVLARLAAAAGYAATAHDPLYAPRDFAPGERWDAVLCHEVTEHFREPAAEFDRLAGILAPEGVLVVVTQPPPEDVANWWYAKDLTHLCFYTPRTMDWLAGRHGWRVERVEEDLVVFGVAAGSADSLC